MDGITVITFMRTLALLSLLLMAGMVLRAKVSWLQKLYIPASVIGGTLGLILGPELLDIIPVSDEVFAVATDLPARAFGFVIAGLPMCAHKMKKSELKAKIDIWTMTGILCAVGALQVAIGLGVNVVSQWTSNPTYAGFGTEMMMGFCGGHGLGAIVGSYFQGLGQDYWETAQGVAMSCATIGMVGGILLGTIVINYAIKKKKTNYVRDISEISEDMRCGLYADEEKRPVFGNETTNPGAIDTLTLHIALLGLAVGLGYIVSDFVYAHEVPFLKDFDSWVFMLIAMYVIWPIVRAVGADKYFDERIKSRIEGFITDFIVAAAIFTMPLDMVLANIAPLAASCLIGLLGTVGVVWFFSQRYMTEDPTEKAMGPMGMLTGDFITGVLLTKMIDPEMKSNSLSDFSIAYTLNTFYMLALL
ncbi:MAG: sodium/glutamate symporter, partial [Anaerovoracaceae bacterium]